jgi:hypothetical protein
MKFAPSWNRRILSPLPLTSLLCYNLFVCLFTHTCVRVCRMA